jgi:hypothetical protein
MAPPSRNQSKVMAVRRGLWATRLFVACALVLCSCGGELAQTRPEDETGSAPADRASMQTMQTMRAPPAVLARSETEAPGYGAYSYILFRSSPDDDRGRAIFQAYLSHVPPAAAFPERPRALRNVTYVPVDARPSQRESTDPQWFCTHYDWMRADQIIQGQALSSFGPYLITSKVPLTGISQPVSGAIIDLSRAAAASAASWMEQFLRVSDRADTWLAAGSGQLGLQLYDAGVVAGQRAFTLQDPLVEGGRTFVMVMATASPPP